MTLIKDLLHLVGSCIKLSSIGFRGPEFIDCKTITAITVMLRYLEDSSASPLSQTFVEVDPPWCTEAWTCLNSGALSYFVIGFDGVPLMSSDSGCDGESVRDSDSQSDYENEEEASFISHTKDLFAVGVFKDALDQLFLDMHSNGFVSGTRNIKDCIQREKVKLLEELELDPHTCITEDIVVAAVSAKFSKIAAVHKELGYTYKRIQVLHELENENDEFWRDLFKKWFIDAPNIEVKMLPDIELGEKLEHEQAKAREALIEQIGPSGLEELRKKAQLAIEKNKVNIPASIRDQMPPLPKITGVPRIPLDIKLEKLPFGEKKIRPFSHVLHGTTESNFIELALAIPAASFSEHLQLYIVLFNALLFQCSLELPSGEILDYCDFASIISKDFVSLSSSLGRGSSYFNASWLSQYLFIETRCEPHKFKLVCEWIIKALCYSVFTVERISITIGKLLSEITDLKRDGESMLKSLRQRLTSFSLESPERISNEICMNIFTQEKFLKSVRTQLSQAPETVICDLKTLRTLLLSQCGANSNPRSFVQLYESPGNSDSLKIFTDALNSYGDGFTTENRADSSPFPIPRVAYRPQNATAHNAIHVPLSSLTSSYLDMLIACDTLSNPTGNEHASVRLLCELLTQTEGPLFTRVRGKGYAYGASVSHLSWKGILHYEVWDASDPIKSIAEFTDLLTELKDKDAWNKVCNDEKLQEVKAAVAFEWFEARSNGLAACSAALNGFSRVIIVLVLFLGIHFSANG